MDVRTPRFPDSILPAVLIGAVLLGATGRRPAAAQEAEKPVPVRFGITADTEVYPQATAKQALASVIKAVERRRFDYLLAHLADPAFVDARMKAYPGAGAFDAVVKEVVEKIAADPTTVDDLRAFLRQGTWEEADGTATVKLDAAKGRTVVLKKLDDRWVLDNRRTPEPPK